MSLLVRFGVIIQRMEKTKTKQTPPTSFAFEITKHIKPPDTLSNLGSGVEQYFSGTV